MFESAIVDQNPHWDGSLYSEGVVREVIARVKEYLPLPHIIALVGVRRSGKSTLARQIINHLIRDNGVPARNILFLNLENPQFSRYRNDVAYLERAYEDYLMLASPEGMVYCVLDEVHYFEEWRVFVKARYERQNIKFIITGSNSHLLSSEFITLLSGRALPIEVYPFSFAEFALASGVAITDTVSVVRERNRLRKLLDDYLHSGGFPETAFISDERVKKELMVMYARNILYQDIAPRFAIKKGVELENLFFYLASNTASLYTFNKLADLVKLSDKTVKDFLSYFHDAYLLFTVDSFSFSVKAQIKSPKKVYLIDTGMAGAVGLKFSENMGRLLENLVFLKLKRRGKELYYYKTANGLEVDFVWRENGKVMELVQVAWELNAAKTRTREVKALLKAMDETGLNKGVIVTLEDEEEIVSGGKVIQVVPAYKYLMGYLRNLRQSM